MQSVWNWLKSSQKWLVLMAVAAVFVVLRLWAIEGSFWFFGDLGRDLWVLQQWSEHLFRPPLLGPQTSVVSFNQSAWYYYYLFPFFLISNHSVYSTLAATLFLYLAAFVGAFVALKEPRRVWRAAALFYLIAIHPQFVLQHRYVWNPSLATPFLLAGFWAWWRYKEKPAWWLISVFAAGISLAAGFNFSLIPTAAVMVVIFLWEQRRNLQAWWQLLVSGLVANVFIHLPTIIFEIRHNFLLSKNLPTQELLQQEPQLEQRFSLLLTHILAPNQYGELSLKIAMVLGLVLAFFALRSTRLSGSWVFSRAIWIAVGNALIMLALPFRAHEHYVFGVLTFLLVAITQLPRRLLWLIVVFFTWLYIQPFYFSLYQKPAPHTVSEQRQCIQQVCQAIKDSQLEPIFVNTHSASHNHQAREYIFWLREFGCNAVDTQAYNASPTDSMAVVADRAEFTLGETGYYELSQFGEAEELSVIECTPDLQIHLLEKSTAQ